MENQKTISSVFIEQAERQGGREAILEKQGANWIAFSWQEWLARSRAIAAALLDLDVQPGEHVAVFSYSRRQWVEADQAVVMIGGCTVTIYHNLSPQTVRYICEDCRCRIVFAEGPQQLLALFGANGEPHGAVQKIIYTVDCQTPLPKPGETTKPKDVTILDAVPEGKRGMLVPYEEFVARGESLLGTHRALIDKRVAAIRANDVAKIIYTSGTTGDPKGAMLTHEGLLFVLKSVGETLGMTAADRMLMFLPLAHVYAQLAYHAWIVNGYSTAFAQSMLTAVEDAGAVKPTFFATVPRLFEKVHAGALSQVEKKGGLKKIVFQWATKVGSRVSNAKQNGAKVGMLLEVQRKVADKLVYSKLKDKLGGRVRFMISGGAPLPRHLAEFFHAAGLLILEGYGMTENASLTHYNPLSRTKFGTVGPVIPGVDCRIADDGEILVRGPNVMKGYLNSPTDTAESIDKDGWLHTGDVGYVDADGYLTITDRKKEIIVTSGGKNVPPQPLERKLSESRFVSQVVVFGDRRRYIVALMTLDLEYLRLWAKESGVAYENIEQLARSPELIKAVQAEVDKVNATVNPFSTVKRFALLASEFSIQEGELTPSLKLKRKVIEERHRAVIASLYPSEG